MDQPSVPPENSGKRQVKKEGTTKYVYQIDGVLETMTGNVGGFRARLCSLDFLGSVDVPASIFNKELLAYIKWRLKVNEHLDVRKLPVEIQNQIREPMNRYLDNWVSQYGAL